LVLFGFSSTSGKIIIIYIVLTDYNYRGYLEIAYFCQRIKLCTVACINYTKG
jgi:hypothetical protein